MQIGIAGLGRMGMNMARRLLRSRHRVVAWNRSYDKTRQIGRAGALAVKSLEEMVSKLRPPRVIWLMLPAGGPTEEAFSALKGMLQKGDLLIDGANGHYKEAVRKAEELKPLGIGFMDAGVSGGIWGLKNGYCLMVGGEKSAYQRALPAIKSLAPKDGYLHCGPAGAGHFVKMVHNGIEYGMMAAYGEGFEILSASPYGRQFDFEKIASLWNHGSVVRSWLLELAEDAFSRDPRLKSLEPVVSDSGEGRWCVQQAVESAVPAPVITASLYQRFGSRGQGAFSNRLLAALRAEFGGHAVVQTGVRAGSRAKKAKP